MTLEAFLRGFGSSLPEASAWAAGIALVAGVVASAVCPCTLPVGLGVAGVAGASEQQSRRNGFLVALFFFLGIVVNLTILGALVGRVGAVLTESFGRYWALTMMIVSLLAAIIAFRGPRLSVDRLASLRRSGLLGAFGYGFVFSLGTSAAPLLLLLTIAAAEARPLYGMLLAFAFGIGRGLPFLVAGFVAGAIMRLARLSMWRRTIQILSGCALLVVSAYFGWVFTSLLRTIK